MHTISEHKQQSRFQACAVVRYQHARQYHYFDMQLKDQIQVRKDLLAIDKLREECNYILDNDITDISCVKQRLEEVTKEIGEIKAASYDAALADSIYTSDELEIRREYYSLYDRLMTADSSMSDEEYELLSDRLEELESSYADILLAPIVKKNPFMQDRLNGLYEERRILKRIVKDEEVYNGVTESVTFKDNIKDTSKNKDRNI